MKRLLFCLLVLFHFDLFAACRPNSGNHVVMKVNCSATPGSCSGVGTLNGYPAYGTPAGNSYCGGYGWMYCPVTDLHVCDNQEDFCNARPDLQQCANECTQDRADCLAADGTWSGSVMTTTSGKCCTSVCDLCSTSSQKKIAENKRIICCAQEMAPPGEAVQCQTRTESKCGMTISKISSNAYEYSCRDPNLSSEAAQAYFQQCLNINSSSSVASSSSSSGGGGGGSGSSAACGEECDWLRWILDTLTTQREIVEDIHSCLTNKLLCDFGNQPDTSTIPFLRPYLDSIMIISDKEITILGRIDTSLFKLDTGFRKYVDIGTEGLQNDTLTRAVIVDGNLKVLDSLGKIRSSVSGIPGSVDVLNDSTRKYFEKLADTLGISLDSLLSHLDSIKKNIPGDILDSIAKYERLNYEKELIVDDLPLIDSLIDSTVTYFKLMHKYDSIRHVLLSDSLGSIHDAINGVAYGIGEQFGYGDTASSTLRKDVNAIGDTLSKYFNGSYVDSSSVVYGSGFVSEGERFGDSLGRAVGWIGGLDGVNTDSVFKSAGFDSLNVDSVGRAVDDSLNGIADSLNAVLVLQNDSIKRGLPDSLDVWADSLIANSPWASFDSLIFGQLGAKIPNSNQCPDDCNKWEISLPRFGLFNFTIDYGLCFGRVPLGGMNVLGFIRLLLRITVVWACIWIVFNAMTKRKD